MKKTNNKGFSLVELIIVIAIMAILAGAIAPALIRYIDRSRKSNDINACKSIKTAFETALTNEDLYSELTTGVTTYTITEASTTVSPAIAKGNGGKDIFSNLSGQKAPKLKYKKQGANAYKVEISTSGEVKVSITDGSHDWAICPEVCEDYQK
ncbi:MAG: type II secretion system protein [Lachnospiraceae bacterium]|nr:type II secretion system protein [Lachnospiraceae bacterium]